MNRIIKFRGKTDKNDLLFPNPKWVYGYLTIAKLHSLHKIHYQLEDCTWVNATVIPDTVGQFVCMIPNTSMYVDNSRELYEGDLIKEKDRSTIYQILYEKSEFYGIANQGDDYGDFTVRLLEKSVLAGLEIIGNVHDNPDLLTTE